MVKRKDKSSKLRLLIRFAVLFLAVAVTAKGVSAQNPVGWLVDLIKGTYEKGFKMITDESQRFLYARKTPNYIAYTGLKADYGSHIVRLEKDGQAIEYTFVELREVFNQEATASATPEEKQATPSALAELTEEQREKLEEWDRELQEIQEGIGEVSEKVEQVGEEVEEIDKEVREIVAKAQLTEGAIERIVKYENIAKDTDLVYRLTPQGMGEEIILKELASSQPIQSISFVFEINPLGLSFRDTGNGVWYFYDSSGEAWLRFPKAYAVDADKKFTNNVSTQITKEEIEGETKTLLIITLDDPEWLNDSERQFPVTIYNAIELIPDKRGEL